VIDEDAGGLLPGHRQMLGTSLGSETTQGRPQSAGLQGARPATTRGMTQGSNDDGSKGVHGQANDDETGTRVGHAIDEAGYAWPATTRRGERMGTRSSMGREIITRPCNATLNR